MAEVITKQTFGGASVAMIRPDIDLGNRALNVHLTFDEALKLHFAVGQALARIGRYNRSTSAGKRAAVNLCLFVGKRRVTVNESQLPKNPRRPALLRPDAGDDAGAAADTSNDPAE